VRARPADGSAGGKGADFLDPIEVPAAPVADAFARIDDRAPFERRRYVVADQRASEAANIARVSARVYGSSTP